MRGSLPSRQIIAPSGSCGFDVLLAIRRLLVGSSRFGIPERGRRAGAKNGTGQFISMRKAVQTADDPREIVEAKAQLKRTPQMNLVPSIVFSLLVLAPCASGDGGGFNLIHTRGCRTAQTNGKRRWSPERYCSDGLNLSR
jgi:hypothetical protein